MVGHQQRAHQRAAVDGQAQGGDLPAQSGQPGQRAGAPSALGALDEHLAEELWAGGTAAWRAVAALAGAWRGEVLYADAPYGVGYAVATWVR